ncbi:tRNA 2-thiouridine synthesizing protein A [Faunimonas pinastri]|uniref:tRNA 2-thiouridine synthesizing protein A n=1 Tax=Faunimonas pinastri TaxID=1855383 RepID=A0A1H9NL44_9HYPH|nr:sulfurtransferase TusA family protein [Faunimonas pinastri]SER36656.1 tRNA 2-thiouridine synthesizing protein A [Faunimonas pinastri]
MEASRRLDLRGLKCPLPVLKTGRAVRDLPAGSRIEVLATDPMAAIDIPHFCREQGHRLLEQTREADHLRFLIAVGEGAAFSPPSRDGEASA